MATNDPGVTGAPIPAPGQLRELIQRWREQAQVQRVALEHSDQVRDQVYCERLRSLAWTFDLCAKELEAVLAGEIPGR